MGKIVTVKMLHLMFQINTMELIKRDRMSVLKVSILP